MQKLVKSGYSLPMTSHADQGGSAPGRPPKAAHADIVQAAWALFEDVGFDAASMSAVADRAGVSRRTLFNYFPHKADLLFHGWDEFMKEFRTELLRQPQDAPLFTMLTSAFWKLAPYAEELEARFHPGPEVVAARQRADNIAYWKGQWGHKMEQLVLDVFGSEHRMKAGFVGAIAAQGWAEFTHIQGSSAAPVRADAAMALVLSELSEVIGVPLLQSRIER